MAENVLNHRRRRDRKQWMDLDRVKTQVTRYSARIARHQMLDGRDARDHVDAFHGGRDELGAVDIPKRARFQSVKAVDIHPNHRPHAVELRCAGNAASTGVASRFENDIRTATRQESRCTPTALTISKAWNVCESAEESEARSKYTDATSCECKRGAPLTLVNGDASLCGLPTGSLNAVGKPVRKSDHGRDLGSEHGTGDPGDGHESGQVTCEVGRLILRKKHALEIAGTALRVANVDSREEARWPRDCGSFHPVAVGEAGRKYATGHRAAEFNGTRNGLAGAVRRPGCRCDNVQASARICRGLVKAAEASFPEATIHNRPLAGEQHKSRPRRACARARPGAGRIRRVA